MSAPARAPLYFEDTGAGEPALVLLHYFGGSGGVWGEVIDALGPWFRCFAPDLRGFGKSEGPPAVASIPEHVDDVLAAISAGGVGRYVLVGHSMGGKIAMAMAIRRPPGLCGLVLVAPSPPSPEPLDDAEREAQLDGFGDRTTVEAVIAKIAVRQISPAARARFIADALAPSRESWVWWLQTGSRVDMSDEAAALDLPCLIVSGAQDAAISPDVVRATVVEVIAGSRFHTLADAGHLLPYEAANALARLIAAFLAEIAPAPLHHLRWSPSPAMRGRGRSSDVNRL